jgi:outer membrane protein assembly factor BamB
MRFASHRTSLVLLALSASTVVGGAAAQAPAVAPLWSRDLTAPISWQRVTTFGQLLVATSTGLYSLDPETGEQQWSLPELRDLTAASVAEIAGSPLVLISDADELGRTLIVNVFNGTLVFDSRDADLAVSSTHLLPRTGGLLIAGFETDNPEPSLFAYGIDDGVRRWESDALAVRGRMSGLVNLLAAVALSVTDTTPVQSPPLELDDGSFILGAMGNVLRFDATTGAVAWKAPYAGGRFELRVASQRPGIIYIGAEEIQTTTGADGSTEHEHATTMYQGFRVSNGDAVWGRPTRFNKPMNSLVIPLEQGLLVSEGDANKGKLQLLEYDTGAGLWGNRGKGIEISGQVLDYAFAGSDLILTTGYDSVWSNKDTEYLLYVLDTATGAFRFAEPFKVKGRMLSTELTEQGLVYVTTHEINVFDPATGTLKNAPVLRSKEPLVTAHEGRTVFAFNSTDGFVYAFDRESGTIARFSQAPFEFPEHDFARSLDIVDGHVALLGWQTVAGFSPAGTLAFAVHHPAPRDPAWLRALAWAEGIRAGMASAYAGAYSAAAASVAADSAEGSLEHELATELEQGFGTLQQGYQGLATEYVNFARRRYEASAESRDFAFIMTQDHERRVSLAQVSKRDGRILAQIDLGRDKEPDYQVDDVQGFVFYRPSASVITAYAFAAEPVRVAAQ